MRTARGVPLEPLLHADTGIAGGSGAHALIDELHLNIHSWVRAAADMLQAQRFRSGAAT